MTKTNFGLPTWRKNHHGIEVVQLTYEDGFISRYTKSKIKNSNSKVSRLDKCLF